MRFPSSNAIKSFINRAHNVFFLSVLQENPYLALQMEDEEGAASQGYYLEPCDSGLRNSKRYVESPVHSPSGEQPDVEGGAARYAYKSSS